MLFFHINFSLVAHILLCHILSSFEFFSRKGNNEIVSKCTVPYRTQYQNIREGQKQSSVNGKWRGEPP